MKISFELNYSQLDGIKNILYNCENSKPFDSIEKKFKTSLLANAFKIILKKCDSKKNKKSNIKPFKLTLPFAEATILWEFLSNFDSIDFYDSNLSRLISEKIYVELLKN